MTISKRTRLAINDHYYKEIIYVTPQLVANIFESFMLSPLIVSEICHLFSLTKSLIAFTLI